MNQQYYWSRNALVLDNPEINPTFHEVLLMSEDELTAWIDKARSSILKIWDETGLPPLAGKDADEMKADFKQMSSYPVSKFQVTDVLDGKNNVILNTATGLGPCVNQFFPTMMKAKINYNTNAKDGEFNGYSVYDLFANDRFRNRMHLGFRRHFRRDSFYRYSCSIEAGTDMGRIHAETGAKYLDAFFKYPSLVEGYDFWLNPVDPTNIEEKGSGYTQVDASKFLWVSAEELGRFSLSPQHLANVGEIKDGLQYHIRFYNKEDRIFPAGFTAFKIGYIQVAVNFPPLIAKFLYEKYTDHCDKSKVITVYDPSSGWGGRISGAMCVRDDRTIHYVGTDPNMDNYLPELGKSRYEYVAEFISDALDEGNLNRLCGNGVHTYHVFQSGSETIHELPEFQQYKGKLDFIFTSPPYFNREGYSEDEAQSLKKFPQYESWRDGFLKQTLKTCAEYLKPNRYLAWNIADIKVGDSYYPLEEDSRRFLEEFGLQFVGIEKMALANMPGSNRMKEDGTPSCKNFFKYGRDGDKWRKFEPIFLYWKGPGDPPYVPKV